MLRERLIKFLTWRPSTDAFEVEDGAYRQIVQEVIEEERPQ